MTSDVLGVTGHQGLSPRSMPQCQTSRDEIDAYEAGLFKQVTF